MATVIFTSGSTGNPKGVVLSHRNVLSNAYQIEQQVEMKPDEVVLGILPFFHAFGFTVTIWTALSLGKKVVYHFNPLDARTIGKLCEEHKVSLLIGTPSFMRYYLKSCEPRQFATLTHLILGAEKLKPEFAREIQQALGIDPLEGYGCTELSPVVAVNVPKDVQLRDGRVVHGNRLGTVGLPLPGTSIKTIDPDTGQDLPPGSEGIVAVKGPQVMVGYLDRPDATAKVIRDGWYATGDIGLVDPDGFVRITDRLSRFSKIAGEMVPHVTLESTLMEITGVDEHHIAVTGVPDAKHGEKLCVIYTDMGLSPAEVHQPAHGWETAEALDSLGAGLHPGGADTDHGHGQDRPEVPSRCGPWQVQVDRRAFDSGIVEIPVEGWREYGPTPRGAGSHGTSVPRRMLNLLPAASSWWRPLRDRTSPVRAGPEPRFPA